MDFNQTDSVYAEMPAEQETVLASYQSRAERTEARSMYATIVRWTLVIGIFLMPIFFLPWTTGVLELNKQALLLAAAGIGLIAWLLSLVSTGRFSWRSTPFDKGILAILGATVVASIFSASRYQSFFGQPGNLAAALATLCAVTLVYFLVVNSSDELNAMGLADLLGLSLTIALAYGLLQVLGVYVIRLPFALNHGFNSIGSVNALGIIAAVTLPLFANNKTQGWLKYVHRTGLVLGLVLLVVINWWILWAVAIAGMAGLVIFQSLDRHGFSLSRFLLPMVVIVLAVFLMVVNFNLNAVKKNLPVEVAPSFSLSGNIVKSALKEHFATGYGPGKFSMAFDKYGARQLSDSTLSTAKFFAATSGALTSVTEGGLLMILAFLVFAWSLVQGIMFYVKNKQSFAHTHAENLWAMLVALAAAFFLYPFNVTLLVISYVVLGLIGLTLWSQARKDFHVEDNVKLSLASSVGFIAGLILVLVGMYFGASAYVADTAYAKALGEKDINAAAGRLVTAVNWNGHNDLYYRTASQAALGLLSQELKKPADKADTQRQARVQNYMSSAVNLAKTATTLEPNESLNWNNLGNVYQNLLGLVDGVDSLAESSFKKAAELRPGDATFYNEIGNLYLSKAQIARQLAAGNANAAELNQVATESLAKAETNFKKAVELSNNFGLAIYNLGVVYDQEGKLPEAIKQLERVAPFNADQPDLLFELGLLYYRNGTKDKAFDALQQVLILQPNFSNAHWYLSLIYEERKDIPNAVDQLQKILAVEANKDNQTVLTKLQQLQAGQTTAVKGVDQKPL
jgi:Flp pilus assembly protein TadD